MYLTGLIDQLLANSASVYREHAASTVISCLLRTQWTLDLRRLLICDLLLEHLSVAPVLHVSADGHEDPPADDDNLPELLSVSDDGLEYMDRIQISAISAQRMAWIRMLSEPVLDHTQRHPWNALFYGLQVFTGPSDDLELTLSNEEMADVPLAIGDDEETTLRRVKDSKAYLQDLDQYWKSQ
ncbi:hypothetical protein C8J56DRAFT_1044959 [Mycena floridula]|nr:hypothetical protein C8J56DRAFT_1044959 [Mycena floridula]